MARRTGTRRFQGIPPTAFERKRVSFPLLLPPDSLRVLVALKHAPYKDAPLHVRAVEHRAGKLYITLEAEL